MVNHEDQNQQKKKMEEKEKEKNPQPENKTDNNNADEKKNKKEDDEANKEAPPPPPPQEVVLKVFMHCEGCAKKVKRSLKGFPGVEDVITDSKTHEVVVKGEKADPVKVMERIQMKTHRRVELISPIPIAKPESPKAPDEPKPAEEEKKKKDEGPKVITVVLKVHMHCDACSIAIKKRILRMEGVDRVETDLNSSEVMVVGVLDPVKLVEYLYKRTGKHAVIVKQEPSPDKKGEEEKKEEGKGNDNKEDEKKQKTDQGAAEAGMEGEVAEKKEEQVKENGGGGGDEDEKAKLIGLKQNEFCYYPAFYPPKYAMDQYYYSTHPPQMMFSDENPNACSVM